MSESSILTFLFTDIEGSTSKWEEQPEQMAQAVGRHDALLRDAVQATGAGSSRRPATASMLRSKRRRTGWRPTIEIQLALLDPAATAGMGLRVRCGLHTGAVQARDNDYFGSTINRTARIMNAAHGGQVLVSQAIADQLRDRLPERVELKDLGSVRLKGPRNVGSRLPGRASEALPELPGAARARGDAQQPAAAADLVHRTRARARGGRGHADEHPAADAPRHGRPRQDPAVACRSARP